MDLNVEVPLLREVLKTEVLPLARERGGAVLDVVDQMLSGPNWGLGWVRNHLQMVVVRMPQLGYVVKGSAEQRALTALLNAALGLTADEDPRAARLHVAQARGHLEEWKALRDAGQQAGPDGMNAAYSAGKAGLLASAERLGVSDLIKP